jgi:hypothetical protein
VEFAPRLGRGALAILVIFASLSGCSSGSKEAAKPAPPATWWESEPKLAPKNFKRLSADTVSSDGKVVTGNRVTATVPPSVLNETAELSVREALGRFGTEIGGPIVGLQHRKKLGGAIRVEWDVAELTPREQQTMLLVRWSDKQKRWVPSPVEPKIVDGSLSAELTEWSFYSWIANVGQTGQEVVGRRVDAPKCSQEKLHSWVAAVVDPDEETNAAAVRVCFENDRDEKVTMRVANNRTFGQFIRVDGTSGWAWTWNGEDELSAVQVVRRGAAAVLNNDRRIFVPPLREIAVGIDRPDTGGSHFIEFRNESTAETVLVDAMIFAMSKLDIPAAGIEKVGIFVEALIECALQGIIQGGPPPDVDGVARLIVSSVSTCVATINDPKTELGLKLRTKLSTRIAEFPNAAAASEAMKTDRVLRSASTVLRGLAFVEIAGYLADIGFEQLVGDLRWSIRGTGTNSPLGEWRPTCDNVDQDSNQLYRNLALQDEFTDTSFELNEFPGWRAAATKAVMPLASCPKSYLTKLSGRVRAGWGDPKAALIVAASIESLGEKGSTLDELMSAEIPSICEHEPTRLVEGRDIEVDEEHGYFQLMRELREGGSSWATLPATAVGPVTAVAGSCNAGGVGWPDPLLFFDQQGRYLFHSFLDEFNWEDYGMVGPVRNGIRNVTASDGRFIVELSVLRPGDAECCASGYATVAVEILEDRAKVSELISSGNAADSSESATQTDLGD